MLRVLREWVLVRSAPASPLARVCALHLLCRDVRILHDAGMMVLARMRVCFVVLVVRAAVGVRILCKGVVDLFRTNQEARSRVCALHLLSAECRVCHDDAGMMVMARLLGVRSVLLLATVLQFSGTVWWNNCATGSPQTVHLCTMPCLQE